jgi:CHAT domain-containing protein
VAVLGIAGCHSSASPDPAAIYQSVHEDFLHGNLDVARVRAAQARKDWPDWALRFRLLEAEILAYQGHGRDVLALLTAPEVSYPSLGDVAIKRSLLCGSAYAGLGQFPQADEEIGKARTLAYSAKSPLIGEVLRAEAGVQVEQNNLPRALELLQGSLKVARDNNDAYLEASDLLNIGFVAMGMGHYDQALTQFVSAADFARPIEARAVLEAALGDSGWAYLMLGDFDKALYYFQQAEAQAREIGTSSAQVDWLQDAGWSNYQLGHLEEARKYEEQALTAASAQHRTAEAVKIQTSLGFLLFRQGRYDSAKAYGEEAIRLAAAANDKSAALYAKFLLAQITSRRAGTEAAERALLQVHEDSADNPAARWDIENALANLYAGAHRPRQAEPWYRQSIQTFEMQRASVQDEELRLSFFANGDTLYLDYADFLIEAHRAREALQIMDDVRAATLEEGLGVDAREHGAPRQKTDAQATARRLNASILFYSLGVTKSYLWAVTPDHLSVFTLPKQSDLEASLRDYQKAILRSTDPLRDANAAAVSLYDALIAPAAAMLPRDGTVFLIADGALHGLNFETLLMPHGRGLQYWIEEATIVNASSIRLLAQRDAGQARALPKSILLIGNPVAANADFGALRNAADEISQIQKHFSSESRTVLTGPRAVPAAYADSRPDQFSYIHFVAHGTASRLSPLDSAVVLSPAADHPENFKLYARDIVQRPVRASLVTISACYGSGLRTYADEGMVGLAWAFMRAGAHNVIGALWEVNDASTALLMDRLYSEIDAGNAPEAALRAAKLSLIHSPETFRKPRYWGAFQFYAGS